MTERIYYTDPACRAFDAVVTRAFEHDGRPAVTLDRTAFYPTSGGQPFDTGRLGSVDVIDAIDAGDEVIHVVASPLGEGATVHGEIDWARRFDHMQQHTGQHVLSAAFERLFDNRTVSFHMGADTSTIDLAREMALADVDRAVDEANRIVWQDLPVGIRFVTEDEAKALPLRKEPARQGTLRLIEIGDVDLSACGGTHVDRTGVIGLVAATAAERVRGSTRVTFVCGGRALRALRLYRDTVAGSIRILSVLPSELPAAIERIQADSKDLRKTMARMQESLAVHEGEALRASAVHAQGARAVIATIDGRDAQGLKAIASAVVAAPGFVAVLVGAGMPVPVVVARSADVAIDAGTLLRRLVDRFGGRGGGKPDLAQGGIAAGAAAIAAAARDMLA